MRKIIAGLVGLGGLIAAILLARPRFIMRWVERNTPEDALFSVDTTEKVIALTIDDGPHAEITPQILDVMAAYQIKATFFLIGKNVLENGDLVKQIVAGGHEIGNHLMQDQPSIGLKEEIFVDELLANGMLLASYGPVRWFRPGSGWYTKKILAAAKSYGYRCAVGSIYPYDAHISNVPFIAGYVLANAYPGAIIILHDGTDERWHTVDVLKIVLPDLLRRGYRFCTLSELAGE